MNIIEFSSLIFVGSLFAGFLGVAPDPQATAQTLARTLEFVQTQPTIYLPSHDPNSAARLTQGQIVNATFEEVYA